MNKEIKKAAWKCRHCGNTYETFMERGEDIKQPSFCSCKRKDYELIVKKSEYYDEPEKVTTTKKGYEFIGTKENPFKGKKEFVEYNLNQGTFKGHFYYGKPIDLEGQTIESLIFDDGSTLTNWEAYKVEHTVFDSRGKEKRKMLPHGTNQIKDSGFVYKHLIVPQNNDWSNKSIEGFCSNVSRLCSNSVDSVDCVGVGVDTIEYTIGRPIQGSTGLLQKNILSLYYTIGSTRLPTLTTQLHLRTTLVPTLVEILDQYMDVVDRRSLLLSAAFTIATYCYTLFDSTGYLFFNSEKESGKTKFATLISLMSYHSVNCTNPSEAALYRITSLGKGLMVIDDFENISEEKKNALLQIIKVGYRREGKVIRVEKRKDMFVPQIFDCYCPKIITNTTSLEPITLSRCIPIHLMKTLTNKGKLYPREKDNGWQAVRDMCHLFVMLFWKRIVAVYETYECSRLNNRDLELVKGYLSIMKVVDNVFHDQMLDYIVECFKDRETVDMSGSWVYALFSMLLEQAPVEGRWFKAKEITADVRGCIVSEAGCEDEAEFRKKKGGKLPAVRWVGGTLSKIPSFKKRRVGAGVEYWLSKKLIEDYMKIRGFYVEQKKVGDYAANEEKK